MAQLRRFLVPLAFLVILFLTVAILQAQKKNDENARQQQLTQAIQLLQQGSPEAISERLDPHYRDDDNRDDTLAVLDKYQNLRARFSEKNTHIEFGFSLRSARIPEIRPVNHTAMENKTAAATVDNSQAGTVSIAPEKRHAGDMGDSTRSGSSDKLADVFIVHADSPAIKYIYTFGLIGDDKNWMMDRLTIVANDYQPLNEEETPPSEFKISILCDEAKGIEKRCRKK